MKKALLILCSLLAFAGKGFSQDTLAIAAQGQIFNIPDTAYYNDTASYYVWVKNVGSTPFSGFVTLLTMVDTGGGPLMVQVDSLQASLNPNDSLPFLMNETYTPNDYRVGGNIVVIWPSATNAVFLNLSNQHTVYIPGFLHVENISGRGFNVYPIPFKNSLHIIPDHGLEKPARIKLTDISGRQIIEMPYTEFVEFPEELPAGSYMLELLFGDSIQRIHILKAG